MSSSDAWIAALGKKSSTPSPLSQSMAGLSLTTALGSAMGEYGGVAKQTNLLFFVDGGTSVCLCHGFVGPESRRFCLKLLKGDSTTCGVTKHATKFEPKTCHFYLHSNDTTAFCEPCFPKDLVTQELRSSLRTASKTIEEWKQLFTDFLHDSKKKAERASTTTR
jgi:hypothetical protein